LKGPSEVNARVAAIGALGLGLAIALAANLTYAVPRGPVTVGLGLIAPLVLPVVLYIRTTFTAEGFWQLAVREAATFAVAGPAAAISYVHTYELVLSAHEPWLLAVLAPLSSDGLAGMATLALHRMRQRPQPEKKDTPPTAASSKPTPRKAKQAVAAEPRTVADVGTATASEVAPAAATEDDLTPRRIERDQSRRDAGKDWARRQWPVTGGEIAAAVGVSRSEGDRIRAAVKKEKEAVS
jgi:hypothetical protein